MPMLDPNPYDPGAPIDYVGQPGALDPRWRALLAGQTGMTAPPLPPPVDVASRPVAGVGGAGAVSDPFNLGVGQSATMEDAQLPPNATPTVGTAQPQPAPDVPPTSLMGRLGNIAGGAKGWIDDHRNTLMALGTGMAGAQSFGHGLNRTGQNVMPAMQQDVAQQKMTSTVRALIQKGMPPDAAVAAASNPAILQQILPTMFGPKQKKFTQTGEDMFGNKQYGFVDEVAGTVEPAHGLNSATAAGSAEFLAPGATQPNPNLVGDDYLKQFSPEVQAAVKNYVGGQSMPTGNPRKGFTQAVKMIAQKYGQDIGVQADDTTYTARRKLRDQLSSGAIGSIGGQLNAGNTSIGHLADMSDKAIALGNAGTSSFGWLPGSSGIAHMVNTVGNTKGDVSPHVNAFNDLRERYVSEITKFYSGSPGAQAERDRAIAVFDNAKTPQELGQAIRTEAEAMQYKLKSLEGQIAPLGPAASEYPVIKPASLKALDRIETNFRTLHGGPSAAQVAAARDAATAPQAAPATASLPRVASPADAAKLKSGTHFLDPDGNERIRP